MLAVLLALSASACIAPSVVDEKDRATQLDGEELEWSRADASHVPGTYVSTELSGPVAAVLRKVVYYFAADGSYTGAGLVDDVPPRFEVTSGSWSFEADTLRLDDGPPAQLEVAQDGSLRLTGEDGSVILRRERER